jgi:MFS family permease
LTIRLILPWLGQWLTEWRAIFIALGVSAIAYAIYPFLSQLSSMFITSFILGLGLGLSQPMTLALLHRYAPEGRQGEAVGMRLAMINVSQSSLPSAFGFTGALTGLGPVFWMMAVVSAGSSWMAWRRSRAH